MEKMNDDFSKAYADMRQGKPNQILYDGIITEDQFLGFPECCTVECASDEKAHMEMLAKRGKLGVRPVGLSLDEENRLRQRLGNQFRPVFGNDFPEAYMSVNRMLGEKSKVLRSYFTYSFYPCKPGCIDAVNVGERILAALHEESPELAELYEKTVLPANVMNLYSKCVYSPGVSPKRILGIADDTIAQAINDII